VLLKLTNFRYSAIMRGAVLHKLGLNVVRERLMRRHYGVSFNRLGFNPRKDPVHLKGIDAAGDVICKGVMKWYAKKVPPAWKK